MTGRRVVVLDHTASLGGAEIALTRLLEALDPSRFEVSVVLFAPGQLEQHLTERGIAVSVLPLAPEVAERGRGALVAGPLRLLRDGYQTARFTARLARVLRRRRPDLVVANSLKSAVVCAAAAPLAGVRWVWHLHDRLSPDYLPSVVARGMRVLARHGPQQVVANSMATARLLGPVSPGKLHVAYPGLPASAFATTERRPVEPPVVGMLGRIASTKGQREFIEAAALVCRDQPAATFRVIGTALFNDDAYAEEVRALPGRLRIADRVQFSGWAPDPARALDDLTVLVHASPVPEPFGQVVVEAMARRVPVIATRGGGVTEILDPGEVTVAEPGSAVRTGLGQLVSPGDVTGLAAGMRWVLCEPVAARELATAAGDSVRERFTIASTAEVISTVWDRAINPDPHPTAA